jgi:DNA replication and repair protein RecF
VWNSHPAYLKEVQTYERVLRSRNALLRSEGRAGSLEEMLPIYDEQLASAGAVLMCRRHGYLAELGGAIAAAFDRVGRSGLPVTVRYRGTVPLHAGDSAASPEALERCAGELRARLLRDRRRDGLRGFTHSGPHADDVDLELAGQPAAQFASQGQLRALMLALKIAEIRHLRAVLGDSPVLLLDDVSSELDPLRNQYLFEFLREVPCQAFITTTSAGHIQLVEERLDFRVEAGCATVA